MEVVIHLHCRSPTARPDAFDFLQREHAVRRRAFVSDAQLPLTVFEKLFAAAQQARDVGANLDIEFTARLGREHGVVADHVVYFKLGQIQPLASSRMTSSLKYPTSSCA